MKSILFILTFLISFSVSLYADSSSEAFRTGGKKICLNFQGADQSECNAHLDKFLADYSFKPGTNTKRYILDLFQNLYSSPAMKAHDVSWKSYQGFKNYKEDTLALRTRIKTIEDSNLDDYFSDVDPMLGLNIKVQPKLTDCINSKAKTNYARALYQCYDQEIKSLAGTY